MAYKYKRNKHKCHIKTSIKSVSVNNFTLLMISAVWQYDNNNIQKRNNMENNILTILIFHSYPKKPCIDGLISAIIADIIYKKDSSNTCLVPYWRSKDSFLRLKNVIEENKRPNQHTRLVYVDCAPELEEEVDYLVDTLENNNHTSIVVHDHHPIKKDSEINRLKDQKQFKYHFDSVNCAAKMMYNLLSPEMKKDLDIEDLLTVVQYSEYEGMNYKVAGKAHAEEISLKAFQEAAKISDATKELGMILNMKMSLFYILDEVLTDEKTWAFFNDKSLSSQQTYERFMIETKKYLDQSKAVISGKDTKAFSASRIKTYMELMNELPALLNAGIQCPDEIVGDNRVDIVAFNINIFKYGRSLEPLVTEELRKRDAEFAILMNDPTVNTEGELSYYFSLRRVDDSCDTRDLVTFLKDMTETKIGGGHPWGSGVTLNESQYKLMVDTLFVGKTC